LIKAPWHGNPSAISYYSLIIPSAPIFVKVYLAGAEGAPAAGEEPLHDLCLCLFDPLLGGEGFFRGFVRQAAIARAVGRNDHRVFPAQLPGGAVGFQVGGEESRQTAEERPGFPGPV